jgi:hypothetical protein
MKILKKIKHISFSSNHRVAGAGGSMEVSELKCGEAGLRSRVISKKHGFMKVTLSYLHPFEII